MIKAVIFDIGNVLVDVNLDRWIPCFKELNVILPENFLKNEKTKEVFYEYEMGNIQQCQEFVKRISRCLEIEEIPFEQFKNAWNEVILKLRPDSFELVKRLKNQHKLYVLSDTNQMHIDYIKDLYQKTYPNEQFEDLFAKCYFSHEMGVAKSSPQAWINILEEQHLKPEECLFIDDMLPNIERAKSLSLNVFHYKPDSKPADIEEKLKALNN
jgi:putative hydrolase of the HAD superfamily